MSRASCILSRLVLLPLALAASGCERNTIVINLSPGGVRVASPCRLPPGSPPAAGAGLPVVSRTPVLPLPARIEHVAGCAGVSFSLAPDGTVLDPRVVVERPPFYGFGNAAVQALTGSRFKANSDPGRRFYSIYNFAFRG